VRHKQLRGWKRTLSDRRLRLSLSLSLSLGRLRLVLQDSLPLLESQLRVPFLGGLERELGLGLGGDQGHQRRQGHQGLLAGGLDEGCEVDVSGLLGALGGEGWDLLGCCAQVLMLMSMSMPPVGMNMDMAGSMVGAIKAIGPSHIMSAWR
jgi:hypothetical protein